MASFDWVDFQYPTRVYVERNSTHNMGNHIKDLGERPFVFAIKEEIRSEDEFQIILTGLKKYSSGCIVYDEFQTLPGYDQLDSASYFLRRSGADLVVAIGGRHTFQVARSLSILARNDLYSADLKPKKFPLRKPPIPMVCIPTGLTIGEESTPDMFTFDRASNDYFYHRDHRLFPEAILIDPALVTGMSRADLMRQAMAVVAAAVESILSKKSNEITNAMSLKAIELVVRSVTTLATDQGNQPARHNLAVASTLCGMSHASTALGLSYSIAQAVHLVTKMDFYSALNILMPHVMEYNLTSSASKYVQIARALDQDIRDISIIEAAIKAVEGVRKLGLDLNIPQRLSDFEIPKSALGNITTLAGDFPLIRNTPRDMERNEIETILITAY